MHQTWYTQNQNNKTTHIPYQVTWNSMAGWMSWQSSDSYCSSTHHKQKTHTQQKQIQETSQGNAGARHVVYVAHQDQTYCCSQVRNELTTFWCWDDNGQGQNSGLFFDYQTWTSPTSGLSMNDPQSQAYLCISIIQTHHVICSWLACSVRSASCPHTRSHERTRKHQPSQFSWRLDS